MSRYILTHFYHVYCLVVEAGFYSDVVERLHVDPANWVAKLEWTQSNAQQNIEQLQILLRLKSI